VTALTLTVWFLMLGHGLACYMAPMRRTSLVTQPIARLRSRSMDYTELLVGSRIVRNKLDHGLATKKYWRVAAVVPAVVSGIVIMLLMVASL
jgi:hypothetical protein